MTLLVAWWVIILTGFIASGTFLVLHRPRHWFRPAALNASGWVIVIFLLYLRSVVSLINKGGVIVAQSWTDNWLQMLIGIAIDALLIFRVWTFLKYQRTHEPKLNWRAKHALNDERQSESSPGSSVP